MTAKRHHYIPQCYLKGFADNPNKPKLHVTDLAERRTFFTKPGNIAAVQHFHRINADGLPPDALENSLSGFEGELAPALERIIARRSITDKNDRSYLLNLMALIAIKNPSHRENFRSFHEEALKRMMQLATATPERWAAQMRWAKAEGAIKPDAETDYKKMRDFIRAGKYRIDLTTDYHLQLEFQAFDNVLPYFFARRWVLLRAPIGRTSFITSDHPVCLMWSDPTRRKGFRPPGHGLRRTQIVFPVSNELAVMGAFEAQEASYDVSELFIAQVNGSIMLHADRQVYARRSDFTYSLTHHTRMMRGTELLNDLAQQRKQTREE